jgi:NAD(P)H-hydrate epimerase
MQRLRAGARFAAIELDGDDAEARRRAAWELASLTHAIVVLKGHRTVVATADRTYVNRTGNAGMACGGMGDVLTGLIAALIGQGLAPFDAACIAVHSHGAAGDALARQIGTHGFLARELADALPATFSTLQTRPFGYR